MFEHPDAQALYRAILDAPDDDAPRLILADWLDENGQPERAEFIRLECTIARDPFADATYPLAQRSRFLLRQSNYAWERVATAPNGVGWGHQTRRGFLEWASFPSINALERQWTKVRKILPVRDIAIRNNKPIDDLAQWSHLGDIRGLSFPDNYRYLTDLALYQLFQSPQCGRWHRLSLGSQRATRYLAHLIANSESCRDLQQLCLACDSSGPDYLPELAQLEHLRDLELGSTGSTPDTFAAFVNAPTSQLQRLNLGHEFGDAYIRLLLESPLMKHLKSFKCNITNRRTFALLLETPHPENLRELRMDIHSNPVAQELQPGPRLPGVTHLWNLCISNVFTNPELVTRIVQSPDVSNLKYLTIQHPHLTDTIAEALLESPYLANLEHLAVNIHDVSPKYQAAFKTRFPQGVHSDTAAMYR